MKVLIKTYGAELFKAGIYKLLWSVFLLLGAYFFTRSILLCIRTLEGKDQSPFDTEWKGWALTACFFVNAWLLGLMMQRMSYGCLGVGIRARAALTTAVARKCYGMAHLTKDTAAEAVSFVANDINKIFQGMQEIHFLWGAPIEAVAIMVLLASLVGKYCLPGVGILCLVVPAQYYFGYRIIKNKVANFPNTNARYSIIQELLPAMKLVKYYGWERFFEGEISDARSREMRLLIRNAIIKTINVTMVFGVPPVVTFAVLVPYELTNENPSGGVFITPQTAFTMLSLFNVLRFPLMLLPKALRCVSEAIQASETIETFLAEPAAPKHDTEGAPGVSFSKATFKHVLGDSPFRLNVPEFSVRPGELVAVVGRVGAGKSSLLQAIMGNMSLESGSAHAAGRMAYVPQTAWCQNLALRDNIIFGEEVDEALYDDVIDACALGLDLQILPQGDQTKAGLRGINLSGGQRQRLNLARCAYFGGDLVLLDNALSAVDHHTAQHIFDRCIKGLFRNKATVLITHQVEFLPRCDKVAIMDEGNCVYFGPWNEGAQKLLSRYLPASHLLAAAGNAEQPRDEKKKPAKAATTTNQDKAKKAAAAHSPSLTLGAAIWEYAWEARWTIFVLSLFFFLSAQTSRQIADYFIRWWTNDFYKKYNPACEGRLYGVLALGGFLTLMLFRGTFLYTWAIGAANRLQVKSVHRILYAPLGFFLTTPVGDLLVSFTKDQDILDEALPDALYYSGIYALILCATTITVSIVIPAFGALAGGLFLVSGLMLSLYLPAATHLKKLRMGTAGDLVTLIAESLDGLTVIQAYNKQQYFTHVTEQRVDDAHRALFGSECLNLWLAFFCDFYGACMVLAVASFGIGQWRVLGSSNVGLAFSQSIQMLVFYTGSIRLVAECIGLFGSGENLAWIANHTPQEGGRLACPALAGDDDEGKPAKSTVGKALPPPAESIEVEIARSKGKHGPPMGWPRTGDVKFDGVVMKYAPHLPPALRGVSFTIRSGEKVGVVGRTGSGKSTLLLALYRMFRLEAGSIKVDGIDISGLSLQQLRRGLSIIPQEPVVFSGSVRSNLDPFDEYGGDAELWSALRDCGLDSTVKMAGGLDARLDGTGGNAWSLGQQQLMCLARAHLKKVPVLCCDEATAALDPATEANVLEIIERIFADRTILTIAHRLDSVIRSDQVIVMDAGQVSEIGVPTALLSKPGGAFSALVDRTGPAGAAALRMMAAEFATERAAAMQMAMRPRPSLDAARRVSLERLSLDRAPHGAAPRAPGAPTASVTLGAPRH
ncbi:ABC transporter, multidrug resistance associated protein [Monoraphidium neglectum]|uniref:ABC transporter, multidrug resistance associated protein n=1 Tax=Monoraphidium neglectum TaxID=145388 RepID=A0A0D2MEW5_9CHLO|nr:ABC transporter, multidrug resistance associated protein [Monoraphidium neglectum]KIZ01660.1 ABC transporter, multidrug resistance associated protein [Monoraphidium neglectum]|eukprot:XP_013900679.1 ABC transporter, multidrug resistance associated protein [Monoraphidium neglectum]